MVYQDLCLLDTSIGVYESFGKNDLLDIYTTVLYIAIQEKHIMNDGHLIGFVRLYYKL